METAGGTIVHILSAPFLRSSDVRWWMFEVSLLDRREDVVLKLVEQIEYINGKKKILLCMVVEIFFFQTWERNY